MESSEAMQVLERAGRADEARQLIDQTAARAQASYAAIEQDETRTPEYKRDELAKTYAQHQESLASELKRLADSVARDEQRDAQGVFGTVGLSGDSASLAISRRDAADRVASVETGQELRDLLARANRSGDEVLARAIAERALDNRDMDTLNAFLSDRPKLQPAAQRLWDAALAGDTGTSRFEHTMRLAALQPPQLVGR